jgi:integrase/recombinase XerC
MKDRTLTRDKYLCDTEIRQLKRTCIDWAIADRARDRINGPKSWIVVDLALSTGLRVSELSALAAEDIDWSNNAITVRRRKKRKVAPVTEYLPLPTKLREHLLDYLGDRKAGPIVLGQRGSLTSRGWQEAWAAACKRAGIRPLSIHKARHTTATMLYRSTHDLRLVQEQLGHTDPATTSIYAGISFEDRARGVERMMKAME